MTKVFWPKSPPPGNLGDILTPFILSKFGIDTEWVHPSTVGKLLGCGSIARFAKPYDTIWGSGIIDSSDEIHRNANPICVRGPLTGAKCGCDNYGDPGLLMPLFVKPSKAWINPLTIIPHYVHWDLSVHVRPDYAYAIRTLTDDITRSCNAIGGSNSIVSSSLHGIIIAHAYGVPAGWWRPDDQLTGDDVKFLDYAHSVGIELTPAKEIEQVKTVLPQRKEIEQCQRNLITSLMSWIGR